LSGKLKPATLCQNQIDREVKISHVKTSPISLTKKKIHKNLDFKIILKDKTQLLFETAIKVKMNSSVVVPVLCCVQ